MDFSLPAIEDDVPTPRSQLSSYTSRINVVMRGVIPAPTLEAGSSEDEYSVGYEMTSPGKDASEGSVDVQGGHEERAGAIEQMLGMLRGDSLSENGDRTEFVWSTSAELPKNIPRGLLQKRVDMLRSNKTRRKSFDVYIERVKAIRQASYDHDILRRNAEQVAAWRDARRQALKQRKKRLLAKSITKKRREMIEREEAEKEEKLAQKENKLAERILCNTERTSQLGQWLIATVLAKSMKMIRESVEAAAAPSPRRSRSQVQISAVSDDSIKAHFATMIKQFISGFTKGNLLRFYCNRKVEKIKEFQASVRGCLHRRRARIELWKMQWDRHLASLQGQVRQQNESKLCTLQPLYKKMAHFRSKLDQKAVSHNSSIFRRLEWVPDVSVEYRDSILSELYTKKRWMHILQRRKWEERKRKRKIQQNGMVALGFYNGARRVQDEAPPHFAHLIPKKELEKLIEETLEKCLTDHHNNLRESLLLYDKSVVGDAEPFSPRAPAGVKKEHAGQSFAVESSSFAAVQSMLFKSPPMPPQQMSFRGSRSRQSVSVIPGIPMLLSPTTPSRDRAQSAFVRRASKFPDPSSPKAAVDILDQPAPDLH